MGSPIHNKNLPVKPSTSEFPKTSPVRPSGAAPVVSQTVPKSGPPLSSAEAQRLGISASNVFRTGIFRPGSDDSPLSFNIGKYSMIGALGRAAEYGEDLVNAAAQIVLSKNGLL